MEDKSKDIQEIKEVASKVDERIDGISKDWDELKTYLEKEFKINIDTPKPSDGE